MSTMKTYSDPDSHPRLFSPGSTLPFVLVTALFLFWGIPSNMNDILIKQFMKSFEITRFKAGLIQSAFYMGYFLLAIPAALVMRKFGYKAGLVIAVSFALSIPNRFATSLLPGLYVHRACVGLRLLADRPKQ